MSENAENGHFEDQRLECAAPKCWLKYTTNIGVTVHRYIRCASKPWCNIGKQNKGKKENQEIPTWATTTKTYIFRKKIFCWLGIW